jgi:integrase
MFGTSVTLEDVGRWLEQQGMGTEPDLLCLVQVLFSRLLGEGGGDRANFHNLNTALAALGTRSFRRDGVEEPAPFLQIVPTAWPFAVGVKGWPQGGTALSRLGMNVSELEARWRAQRAADDLHAVLPVGVVCAFFPPPLWRMAAQVITWGPVETSYRLKRFLLAEAAREVKPTRARKQGGRVAKRTIKQRHDLMRRLMAMLVSLRGHEWKLPGHRDLCVYLEAWQVLPDKIDLEQLDAQDANTDRSAPPLRLVRVAVAEQLGRLERLKQTKQGRRGMLKCYRDALLLSLLVVLGGRVGAISRIRPCDYDPDRKGLGPAVRIFPGKTRPGDEASWKPLPREVAEVFEGWLAYTGLERSEYRERTIWMAEWARQRAIGEPGPESPVGTLQQAVSGDGRAGRRAMIPRDGDPYQGYSPQTLRHLAEQLAKRYGHWWLSQHPEYVGRISDRVFADALLDHSWGESDKYGYSDLERDRERFAGLAAQGVWELVREERGARTAPDWDRVVSAQNRRDEMISVVDHWRSRIAALRGERSQLLNGGDPGDFDALDLKPLIMHMLNDKRELDRISAELDDASDQLEQASAQLQRAEDRIRTAHAARIAVSDQLSDREHAALQERPAAIPLIDVPDPGQLEPIRDWLTRAEVRLAWGVSESTVTNWFKGAGRVPWDATAIHEISERKHHVLVDKLDRTRIAPVVMERINYFLTQPPMGRS